MTTFSSKKDGESAVEVLRLAINDHQREILEIQAKLAARSADVAGVHVPNEEWRAHRQWKAKATYALHKHIAERNDLKERLHALTGTSGAAARYVEEHPAFRKVAGRLLNLFMQRRAVLTSILSVDDLAVLDECQRMVRDAVHEERGEKPPTDIPRRVVRSAAAVADCAPPGGMLTIDEAADLLSVSPSQIYAWIRGGALPYASQGRSKLVPHEGLMRFIDSMREAVGNGRPGPQPASAAAVARMKARP